MTYDSIMKGFIKTINKLDRFVSQSEDDLDELRDRKIYIDKNISLTKMDITKASETSSKLKELIGV